jgi:hypothetical protein
VPPTLVITAVAHHPDVERCVTTGTHVPGNLLVLLGNTAEEFAGSHLDIVVGAPDRPGGRPCGPTRRHPSGTGGSTGRSSPGSCEPATT